MIDNVQPAIFEEHPMARPPNYLGLTLLNLLCCCWPLGIVGLIYTLRVRVLLEQLQCRNPFNNK